jgi:hypothetical protein
VTIKELRDRLREIAERPLNDPEISHGEADDLLIEYIGDEEVSKLFNKIEKWYA